MKTAKTLITVGAVIRLVSGIVSMAFSLFDFLGLAWESFSGSGSGGSLFQENKILQSSVSIIGFAIFGLIYVISSIISLATLGKLHKTGVVIMNMVFGLLTLPVGLFCFFGGKVALSNKTQWAKENLDPATAEKIERHNKAIWWSFLGMLFVYAALSACMFFLNLADGAHVIQNLMSDYQKLVFPGAKAEEATTLTNLSFAVLIPLALGYLYSFMLGCCPSFACRHRLSQFVVYGICYLASAILYVIFLVNFFQGYDAVVSSGLNGNTVLFWVIGAASPVLLFVVFNLPMYLMAFIPPLIRISIWKARDKEPKEGFSFLAAILTIACFFFGVLFARWVFFSFVEFVLMLIKAIAALISAIIGFALVLFLIFFALSFFPSRVTKFTFDDGSYYIVEQYDNGYAKGAWHNPNGSVNVNDHTDYYFGDEVNDLNDYVDRHK